MKTSETTAELFQALHEAQGNVDHARKSGLANEGRRGARRYATLGDVQDACVPALRAAGITYMVYLDGTEPGKIIFDPRDRVWKQDIRAKVAVGEPCPVVIDMPFPVIVLRLIHTSGEWCESRMVVPMVDGDPQDLGKAVTYGHRYLLQNMMAIRAEDDDAQSTRRELPAGNMPAPKPTPKPAPKSLSVEQIMDMIESATDVEHLQRVIWLDHIKDRPEGEDRDKLKAAIGRKLRELAADARA